jgi:hypothetical protein
LSSVGAGECGFEDPVFCLLLRIDLFRKYRMKGKSVIRNYQSKENINYNTGIDIPVPVLNSFFFGYLPYVTVSDPRS